MVSALEAVWRALARQPAGQLSQLAQTLAIAPETLERLLHQLHALGVALQTEAGLYWCLPAPEPLQLDVPGEVHFSLGSTQDRARELLRGGARECLVVAEQQTAGRGRQGKSWISPLGAHLYFSIGWRFARPPAQLAGLSLAVGVSLARALASLGVHVQLKWPNDLWLAGRKLGGVLVELAEVTADSCQAVIGIGLNHRMPHAAQWLPDQAWLDLNASAARGHSRSAVLACCRKQLARDLAQFERSGLDSFRADFERLDGLRGLQLGSAATGSGEAAGIDAQGRLLLRTATGMQTIDSGELKLPRPAPAPWTLLLDCGNTRLKWAWCVPEERILQAGPASALLETSGQARPLGEVMLELQQQLQQWHLHNPPARILLASSHGGDRIAFTRAVADSFQLPVGSLTASADLGRWRSAYAEPRTLGVDRALAMWAGLPELVEGERALLVSVGSALTLDVLEGSGQHLGGLIAVAPVLARTTLRELSPHLDTRGAQYHALAGSSPDAVYAASLQAAAGLIERVARLQACDRILCSGGGAGPVMAILDRGLRIEWRQDLPLLGMLQSLVLEPRLHSATR